MNSLTPRLASPKATVAFFLATLAVLLVMRGYFPAELAIPLEGSDIRPVLLLEFANEPRHLVHIFGESGDPLRDARIEGMTIGNALDYLLMPAYGLLTLSFFAMIAQMLSNARWLWLGWMGIVAALSDAVENAIMFSMVADMADPALEMAILPWPVWIKFGLLALSCGGAALAFFKLKCWVLAALCLPAPLLLIPGMLDPFGLGPIATTTIGLGWLAMALFAARKWLANRQAQST